MTSDVQLDTLESKGLILLAASRPELEYLFRHALVQDAAYGSLLKQERRELHAQVGAALEELYPERRGELAAVLAMHFELAGDTDRAIRYLLEAGQYGRKRNALREAYAAFERASELLDASSMPEDELRRTRVTVGIGKAETGYSFRATEDVFAELEAIVAETEALGDVEQLTQLHMLIALGHLQQGADASEPIVARSLARIEEIGARIGDPSLRALPLALVGMGQVFAGSPSEGVRVLEEALPLLDQSRDSIGAAFARGALAMGYGTLGEFAKAEAAAVRATEIADARGDLIAQLDATLALAWVRSARGDLDSAVPLAQQCVDRSEETGATACVVASSWILGDAFHRQGRYAEAREILQRGADISGVVDRKVWRPTLQAWLGSTLAVLGDLEEGRWDEALVMARSIGNRLGEAGIRAKRAEAAATHNDWAAAFADFEASAATLKAEGARPSLARVLREWGVALQAAGDPDAAAATRRRALGLFEELGLEREAGELRTILALGDTRISFS